MSDTIPKDTSADNDASHPDEDMDELPDTDAPDAVVTGSGSLDESYSER